mmetsp:Transcript_9603/g.35195  ORF Transcript_9603/g.35195 Transcript_9603/m.35195 type:complete len:227 (-) Transcript_9603:1033-1713(-)
MATLNESRQSAYVEGLRVIILIPRYPCLTMPPSARVRTMPFAALMGIPNPMPSASARIAALMPMTSPNSFTNGPPELPGLMAQSIWIYSPLWACRPISAALLCKLLITPRVIVLLRPRGFPMAMTKSPVSSDALSPRGASTKSSGGLVSAPTIFTTARSRSSSFPQTVPWRTWPPARRTLTLVASPTTCAFVTITPFLSTMKPLPCVCFGRDRTPGICKGMSSVKN